MTSVPPGQQPALGRPGTPPSGIPGGPWQPDPTAFAATDVLPPRDRGRPSPGSPPRSAAAAALLNLSGSGAGYAYLGRWGSAAVCLLVTAGLVALGLATDAADLPLLWVLIAALWLGGGAGAGFLLARRHHPRPVTRRSRVVPVVWSGLLVVALVGGFVGYRLAGAAVYADGLDAQSGADCVTAVARFDTVTGPFELTLSGDVPAARVRIAQCAGFVAATQAEDRGDHADAVRRYQDFARKYPGTVLVGFAGENLERTYNTWAQSLRATGDFPGAIRVYRELLGVFDSGEARDDLAATYLELAGQQQLSARTGSGENRAQQAKAAVATLQQIQREFADTPTAPQVPRAYADTFAAADGLFGQGQFCEALPVLDYFVTLPADQQTGGVVATAGAERATAMFQCGLAQYGGSSYPEAITRLDAFLVAYPNDPQAAQARSAMIAATVLEESGEPPLPLPAPVTDNAPGSIPVTIFNDTGHEQHVYLVGPTAHEFVLAACPSCPQSYYGGSVVPELDAEPCADTAGRPALTLYLGPGTYTWVAVSSDGPTEVKTDVVEPGYDYTGCVYTENLFG